MNKRVTAFACAMFAGSLFGQSVIPNNPGKKPTVAIRNATIYPVTSAPIENGTIVFANGTITAVGRDVAIPQGAMVIDGTGLRVYPGMIDSGSRVGLVEIDSVPGSVDTAELGDINPNARAEIAVNPHSNVIPVTRVNGITTAIVEPTGGIISGSSALMQLAGWTPQEMVVKAPVAMHIHFPRLRGGRFAEVPQDEEAEKEAKKNYTQQVDKLRDTLRDAQAYAKAVAARAKDTTVHRYDRDLVLEALVPVVEGGEGRGAGDHAREPRARHPRGDQVRRRNEAEDDPRGRRRRAARDPRAQEAQHPRDPRADPRAAAARGRPVRPDLRERQGALRRRHPVLDPDPGRAQRAQPAVSGRGVRGVRTAEGCGAEGGDDLPRADLRRGGQGGIAGGRQARRRDRDRRRSARDRDAREAPVHRRRGHLAGDESDVVVRKVFEAAIMWSAAAMPPLSFFRILCSSR